ncbi:conserved hypothetical protein [Pediculus humanus corporis]|uniref:Uncharacterized protein n=1 Tax=Pediculus humanus subsp. corporis TaxID=121224 RepID=E0VIA1_PEDHC|nr:uncharacterized protein Phum_PHUM222110 [Pediculus humanus corporis]EEB13107.1 conserved hypothetical protein [Pediculus humanus corporis]
MDSKPVQTNSKVDPNIALSDLQKKLLYIFREYKTKDEIPDTLCADTLQKKFSRIRIKFANFLMVLFVIGSVAVAYSGKQKAKAGETITRRILERNERIKANGDAHHK